MSPRYHDGPRPAARSRARAGSDAPPGSGAASGTPGPGGLAGLAGPERKVTSTRQVMPRGATVYGPSSTCQVPGCTGPARYPGVASVAVMGKPSRAPPDQPRNAARLSKTPRSRALPGTPGGTAGLS